MAPSNVTGLITVGKDDSEEMRRALRSTAAAGGMAQVQVSLACLSADGHALASVESRSEAELRQHAALKLWAFSAGTTRGSSLNTR